MKYVVTGRVLRFLGIALSNKHAESETFEDALPEAVSNGDSLKEDNELEDIELKEASDRFGQRVKDLNAQNMLTIENNAKGKEGSYVISYTVH